MRDESISAEPPVQSGAPEFLQGGGEMGARVRDFDWSATPLGAPAGWPQALRTVIRLILNTGHPMYVWWGPQLLCFYNDAYRQSIGPERHPGSLGQPGRQVWDEIWEIIGPQIDQVMTGGGATWQENALVPITRNGQREDVYWTYSYGPIDDDEAPGGIGGVLVVCTETTQHVLAERRAREEREVLADVVESTDAFIQVADLDYRFLAINRASAGEFERIFGVRPKVGDSMLDLLSDLPEHQAEVKAVWSRALAGEAFTQVQEFGDSGRERRVYEMKFNTLRDRSGATIGAFQFVYDVTERIRDQARLAEAERQLRQTQKIEAIGQLTGGVAHDFNNLLMVILGGLSMIERPGDAQRRQRILEGMRQAAERGASLSRQLLAFARRQPLKAEPVDLRSQLDGMRDLLDRALRGDVHVRTDLSDDLWTILADPAELELVLLNLCVNARDAMPDGGTITISARNAPDIEERGQRGDFVRLSVADNGIGMPAEVLAHVFEPFFTTKEVGKGSGLGLPQVYGFAEQSGGSVHIRSEVGKGATVVLTLPRTDRAPAAAEPLIDLDPTQPKASGSVLLVEDDDEVASLVTDMLGELGYDVIRASTAEAALGALADARPIDMILSDLMMPGRMNGLDLVREARRRRPELPVLLTSGYADAAMREAGRENIRVLRKPYDIQTLAEALREVFKGGEGPGSPT